MNILILDDEQVRHDVFEFHFKSTYPGCRIVHTYSYKECIEAFINNSKFDLVHLDHDLSDFSDSSKMFVQSAFGEEKILKEFTGIDVCDWMIYHLPKTKTPDKVVVHSWNPYGAKRMVDMLKDCGFNAYRQEFSGDL